MREDRPPIRVRSSARTRCGFGWNHLVRLCIGRCRAPLKRSEECAPAPLVNSVRHPRGRELGWLPDSPGRSARGSMEPAPLLRKSRPALHALPQHWPAASMERPANSSAWRPHSIRRERTKPWTQVNAGRHRSLSPYAHRLCCIHRADDHPLVYSTFPPRTSALPAPPLPFPSPSLSRRSRWPLPLLPPVWASVPPPPPRQRWVLPSAGCGWSPRTRLGCA